MKINGIHNKFINIQAYESNDKHNKDKNKINRNNSVDIEISDSAKTLVGKIKESNDLGYSQKVEKIRKVILEGNYKVYSQDIADKIIQTIEEGKGSD